MPNSDSDIRALEPKDNRLGVSFGAALHIYRFIQMVVSILYGDIAFHLEGRFNKGLPDSPYGSFLLVN
tara:strand:+ start:70 stop:273 length:204 start_codon:yes stop_codon:yes gene_type:complete